MSRLTEDQRQEVRALTVRAVTRARAADWEGAGGFVQTVADRYGQQGIHTILLALADTIAAKQGFNYTASGPVVPIFLDVAEGRIEGVDTTPPRIRWAGRFVAARAAQDQHQCQALLDSCAGFDELIDGVSGMFEILVELTGAL